jgi:hypothetical protein
VDFTRSGRFHHVDRTKARAMRASAPSRRFQGGDYPAHKASRQEPGTGTRAQLFSDVRSPLAARAGAAGHPRPEPSHRALPGACAFYNNGHILLAIGWRMKPCAISTVRSCWRTRRGWVYQPGDRAIRLGDRNAHRRLHERHPL